MKVELLIGLALDYWVARAEGYEVERLPNGFLCKGLDFVNPRYSTATSPSAFGGNWAMKIIKRDKLSIESPLDEIEGDVDEFWLVHNTTTTHIGRDKQEPLRAIKRFLVKKAFGEEVPNDFAEGAA